MKLSVIVKLLNNKIDINELINIIEPEILEYKTLLKRKGSSTPVYLIEDTAFLFKIEDFNFLCNLFLNDKLNNYEIMYLMDALSLSSCIKFENEKILESIEEFGFSENGKLSKESVKNYMSWVGK